MVARVRLRTVPTGAACLPYVARTRAGVSSAEASAAEMPGLKSAAGPGEEAAEEEEAEEGDEEEKEDEADGVEQAEQSEQEAAEPEESLGGRQYACLQCMKTFPSSSRYHRHMATHSKLRFFTCSHPGCNKSYSRKTHLDRHALSHEAVRPHVCDEPGCGLSFTTKQKLDKHRTKHNGLQCSICEERFRKRKNLDEHRRKKHGIVGPLFLALPPAPPPALALASEPAFAQEADKDKAPEGKKQEEEGAARQAAHSCEECGQAFEHFRELVAHRRAAHSSKVHICEDCGKAYTRESALKEHQRRVHGEEVVICTYEGCTLSFSSMANFRVHERIVHKGLRPFSCRDCGQTFGYKHVLNRHVSAVHARHKALTVAAAEAVEECPLAPNLQYGGSSSSRPDKQPKRRKTVTADAIPENAAEVQTAEHHAGASGRGSASAADAIPENSADAQTAENHASASGSGPAPAPAAPAPATAGKGVRDEGADKRSDARSPQGAVFEAGSDLYGVLGVSKDASLADIKQAYRIASLRYHPDRRGGSTEIFQRVSEAHETLADPEKRRVYDLTLIWQEEQAVLAELSRQSSSSSSSMVSPSSGCGLRRKPASRSAADKASRKKAAGARKSKTAEAAAAVPHTTSVPAVERKRPTSTRRGMNSASSTFASLKKKPAASGKALTREDVFDFFHGALRSS